MDVMFYECFKEEEEAISRILPEGIKADYNWRTVQESLDEAPEAKLISIRTQSKLPSSWGGKIDGLLSRSQGFDHLRELKQDPDLKAVLGALPPYCSRAVAEQAFMMLLVLKRRAKKQMALFEKFDRNDLTGTECYGKNALIYGMGNIGKNIADIARGLRMNIKAVDPVENVKGIEYVELTEGLTWADALFCSAELNETTEAGLGYAQLKNAKPGLILVNVSRGEITPAEDMYQLVKGDILGGLGMDVFPGERELAFQLRKQRPISDTGLSQIMDISRDYNVIFTPHNAFNTLEALDRKAANTVKAVVQFLKDKTFPLTIS